MQCPVCKVDMIVVEYKKIELDHCEKCHGVWFDSGELELLLETMKAANQPSATNLLNTPEVKLAEKKRRCPICRQKMRKTAIGKEPHILLDVCPRGEGLWFDGGELRQTITHLAGKLPEGVDSQVISFLGEVFEAEGKARDKK